MKYENGPVNIRLEIESLKRTIMHALSAEQANFDRDLRNAVNRLLSNEETIQQMITDAAADAVRTIVDDLRDRVAYEIRSFFLTGEGRKAIQARLFQSFKEWREMP